MNYMQTILTLISIKMRNVNVLIGFLSALLHLTYQIVHRALAAMLASTMSIAILATLNEVDILSRNFLTYNRLLDKRRLKR